MKSIVRLMAITCLLPSVLAAGYWWGSTRSGSLVSNLAEVSPSARKILYYRNPMGQPDTSPVPKKDPMGMDYLPVYEGEEPPSGDRVVKISTEKIQKLGVRTEVVALRELTRTVRAVATVQVDERLLHIVAPKFEGWIQRLYVNTTGQTVKKGEALMDVYSPELITAQHEYLIARKGLKAVENGGPEARSGMERLAGSALQRLHNWDIAESEIQTLRQEGRIRQHVTLRSAVNGVVLEKSAIQGGRFMPGEMLYQIADLSRVWMLADVFEQDLAMVHPGQTATIRIDTYPDKVFNGEVTFIYPTVTAETRTAKVRIELTNNQGLLKPAMYGSVEFASSRSKDKVLVVPDSAVLDTGTRRLVLVDLGEGRFEPRTVKLGIHADGYAEVVGGLTAGETVVVSANFLIDAESNLKAALGSFGHPAHSPLHSPIAGEKAQAQPGPSIAAHALSVHHGEGSIEALDWAHATVTIAHGPIASLKWPAMIMDFRARDTALLRPLKPGQEIVFDITEDSAGEYVIVDIQPAKDKPVSSHRGGH